jgi:tRNA threonylcarbamoyladenosine dehydratase
LFARNIGILTEKEQAHLKNSSIAIAGMGGVGGLLAERLARLGIGQLRIADPGKFEVSNLNRQTFSSISNLGRSKAEVVSSQLKDINPKIRIDWSISAIQKKEDAGIFVDGCDIIVDEMDMGLFKESILLQRASRQKGLFYLFSVAYGFGALCVIFDPAGMTLEEYNGQPSDLDLNGPLKIDVPFAKIMPVIPSYATSANLETIHKMHTGELPGSATSIGAGLAALLAANEVTNLILQKRQIVTAPKFIYVDLLDQKYMVRPIA